MKDLNKCINKITMPKRQCKTCKGKFDKDKEEEEDSYWLIGCVGDCERCFDGEYGD